MSIIHKCYDENKFTLSIKYRLKSSGVLVMDLEMMTAAEGYWGLGMRPLTPINIQLLDWFPITSQLKSPSVSAQPSWKTGRINSKNETNWPKVTVRHILQSKILSVTKNKREPHLSTLFVVAGEFGDWNIFLTVAFIQLVSFVLIYYNAKSD